MRGVIGDTSQRLDDPADLAARPTLVDEAVCLRAATKSGGDGENVSVAESSPRTAPARGTGCIGAAFAPDDVPAVRRLA
jgi:hypothetical protein